jgi:hypothetical protein
MASADRDCVTERHQPKSVCRTYAESLPTFVQVQHVSQGWGQFSVQVMLLVTLPHPPHPQAQCHRHRHLPRTPRLPHRRHLLHPPRYLLLASSVVI